MFMFATDPAESKPKLAAMRAMAQPIFLPKEDTPSSAQIISYFFEL